MLFKKFEILPKKREGFKVVSGTSVRQAMRRLKTEGCSPVIIKNPDDYLHPRRLRKENASPNKNK